MQEEALDSIFNDSAVVCSSEVKPEVKAGFTGYIIIPSNDICLGDLKCPKCLEMETQGIKPTSHWRQLEKNIIRYSIKRFFSVIPGISIVGDVQNFKHIKDLQNKWFLEIRQSKEELSAWKFRFNMSKVSFSDCLMMYNHMRNCFGPKSVFVINNEIYSFNEIELKHQMFTYWNISKLNKRIKREKHPYKSKELREYFNSVFNLHIALQRYDAI